MKRALTTFGNPFGLALYDKEQQNVRGRKQRQQQNGKHQTITWLVLGRAGLCGLGFCPFLVLHHEIPAAGHR